MEELLIESRKLLKHNTPPVDSVLSAIQLFLFDPCKEHFMSAHRAFQLAGIKDVSPEVATFITMALCYINSMYFNAGSEVGRLGDVQVAFQDVKGSHNEAT
jgi:hypothetical protein